MSEAEVSLREARLDDQAAVRDLCGDIWTDRDGDYLPRIYDEWLAGEDQRSCVALRDGELVGIAQCVLLSPTEAWGQGLRVREDARGEGIARYLMDHLFQWAADRGARVARSMVSSWNGPGMGVARGVGFEPTTGFRFAHPSPASTRSHTDVGREVALAWEEWQGSEACRVLHGLGLDLVESWALREITRADMRETGVLAFAGDDGGGMALRGREYDESGENGSKPAIEYAAAAWRGEGAVERLFANIAADAAERGASMARVLIPEHVRFVSDVATAGVDMDTEPHFVFSADLGELVD